MTEPTGPPRLATSTELKRLIDLVAAGNPLQRKRIEAFVRAQDDDYWDFAEGLSRTLSHSFLASDAARHEAARAYNRMCMEILREQIRFKKTGTYLIDNAPTAYEQVYSQHDRMRSYIVGLLLSYLFWPNHYRLFKYYRETLRRSTAARYLEVGAGHGLFAAEAMARLPDLDATVVDISDSSLGIAREMLATFAVDASRVRFVRDDFLKLDPSGADDRGYDLIVMGEVLEHVNQAPEFMAKARALLSDGGRIFMTTCANCPAVDHVYRFHTVEEIVALVRGAGLRVVDDLAIPAEDVPRERWLEELVTINYASVLASE